LEASKSTSIYRLWSSIPFAKRLLEEETEEEEEEEEEEKERDRHRTKENKSGRTSKNF
jgi:CO dehydrogenase/acetyl-CoA synthase beta subunit